MNKKHLTQSFSNSSLGTGIGVQKHTWPLGITMYHVGTLVQLLANVRKQQMMAHVAEFLPPI